MLSLRQILKKLSKETFLKMENFYGLPVTLFLFFIFKFCISQELRGKNVINENQITNRMHANYSAHKVTDRELYATVPALIAMLGYPVESHTIATEDGYLLDLHRIPGNRKASSSGVKNIPVVLIHGFTTSSECFLVMGPERSLGFLLADLGYDVWLMNFRGNKYSRRHVTLSSTNPKYWNFTWHEMGVYDLPAVIDHILKVTGQPQLFCVAHSMGSNVLLVLTSEKPQYNNKIKHMVLLGPSIYIKPVRSPLLNLFFDNFNFIYRTVKMLRITQFGILSNRMLIKIMGTICRDGNPLLQYCKSLYFSAYGKHEESFDPSVAPIMFTHIISGASIQSMLHFLENVMTDRFQKFDPLVKIGKITPEYDLSKVTAPVSIYYAVNDKFVHPNGILKLQKKLPNIVRMYLMPDKLFTHADFVLSKDVKPTINDKIIAEFENFR